MPELVVIVPSRGRPHAVVELAAAFHATCTANTALAFAIDDSDPAHLAYAEHAEASRLASPGLRRPWLLSCNSSTMVEALNQAAMFYATEVAEPAPVIGFMGDDHRPRTKGWDRAYLDALAARPGIVYGNDLIQGENLPTQCAMSTSWVRALGHMAPPPLRHLYVDNYWLTLGRATERITYLPDVVVEHVHPITGKVGWDEGHQRVNQPAMYEADRLAFDAYWREFGARDLAALDRAITTDLLGAESAP